MLYFKKRFPGSIFAEGEGDGGGGGGSDTGGNGGGGDNLAAAREAAKAAGTHLIDDWREALPEDIATDGSLADFKDWRDIPKSYIHTKKMVGKDRIAIPGEKATDEEWTAFYKKLGRPDDPETYEFDPLSDAPQGYQYPKALEGNFKKWAHEAGLTTAQAKKMWSKVVGHTVTSWKDGSGKASAQRQKDFDALKADWGANYKAREDLALKAFNAVNASLGEEHSMPRELLSNPRFLRAFAHIGEIASEDHLGKASGSPSGIMSGLEAKARINEIQADRKGPYWDEKHPKHKAVKKEVQELYRIAYPE